MVKRHLDLAGKIDRGYESLKRSLGVDRDNVVYFVPFLFNAPRRMKNSMDDLREATHGDGALNILFRSNQMWRESPSSFTA